MSSSVILHSDVIKKVKEVGLLEGSKWLMKQASLENADEQSKPLTVQELTINVKTLVRNVLNNTGDGSVAHQPAVVDFVGRKVSHAYQETGVLTWHTAQVVSQVILYMI